MPLRLLFAMHILTGNMYAFIRGKLIEASLSQVILEAHGVGYRLLVPISLMGKLPALGSEMMLQTSFVVREASQALYGFFSCEDRDVFEVLINVSGIGPKTALSILGHLELPGLVDAINRSNVALLSKVPGIGKKTAERLILELRGRLDVMCASNQHVLPNSRADALNALINLGYTHSSAEKAVKQAAAALPDDSDLAALITAALKFQR